MISKNKLCVLSLIVTCMWLLGYSNETSTKTTPTTALSAVDRSNIIIDQASDGTKFYVLINGSNEPIAFIRK